MNFENFVNQLNWKKLAVVALLIMVFIFGIHEIVFWTFFHETNQFVAEVNSEILQQQKDIQKKIADDDREFEARSKKMDAMASNVERQVDKFQADVNEYLVKAEKEREEREKIFDKAFEEAPAKMWAEHRKFGAEMKKEFFRESRDMQKEFSKKMAQKNK